MASPPRPVLRVAVEEWVPWTLLTKAGGTLRVEGPMGKFLDTFSSVLNFDYVLVRPVDQAWGRVYPNGSWDGMMGQLQRREAEFAIGPFGVTQQRETVCDFTDPLHSENNAILMVRPTLQSDMAGFVKPLSGQVWLLALMSLAVMVAMITWVAATEASLYNTVSHNNLAKAALWSLKAFTQEGSERLPGHDCGRVLVTTWLLASLVFTSCYSGILTALLTVPRVTIPINSLDDLVAQNDLPWAVERSSMMLQYFQEAKDGVRKAAYDGLTDLIQDCWVSRQDIASGRYAAICDRTTMKKAMSWDFSTSGKCHLYISRENVYTNIQIAMAFQINSTYRKPANRIIHVLKQTGIMDYWLSTEITNTSQCLRAPTADRSEGTSPLNIETMAGTFLMLVGGLATGAAVFLLEVAATRCQEAAGQRKAARNP